MTYILYILALMLVPIFFVYVKKIWLRDNDLMVIHVKRDFNEKYSEYIVKQYDTQ